MLECCLSPSSSSPSVYKRIFAKILDDKMKVIGITWDFLMSFLFYLYLQILFFQLDSAAFAFNIL